MTTTSRATWTVGEVARAAGLTVRALHHWEAEGLLVPSGRSSAGYRLYDEADLARLQRLLAYRELGLPLAEVRALVDGDGSPLEHLRRQRALVEERITRLRRLAAAVDKQIGAREMGIDLDPQDLLEVFGDIHPDDDPRRHAAEAEQRWGDTDAWRESHRRTSAYGKDDWLAMKAELEDLEARAAAAFAAGTPAEDPAATALAVEHREHISRWFYACDSETHRSLAETYVADERFAAHYDRRAPGLARWWRDAILAS